MLRQTITAIAIATLMASAQARDIPVDDGRVIVHGAQAGFTTNENGITAAYALVTLNNTQKQTAKKFVYVVSECAADAGETAWVDAYGTVVERGFWTATGGTMGDVAAMYVCTLASENKTAAPSKPNRRSF